MTWFNQTELEELKLKHTLAVDKMIESINVVNELKCKIFEIEATRDKDL